MPESGRELYDAAASGSVSLSNFKDHFSSLAAQYAAFRPTYPASLFDALASVCVRRKLAWDCACGTGQATLGLAEHFESVIATDASAQQIAAASAHPRVQYRVAPAEDSGIEARSVDLVTVAQALHWFDLQAFYREVHRVLAPGGVIAVWTYGVLEVEGEDVNRLVQTFYHDIVGPYWPQERRLVENGYGALPFPFEELTAPKLAMEAHWPLSHLIGYLKSWSSTSRFVAANGWDPTEKLHEQLSTYWGNPDAPRVIRWPLFVRLGRVSGGEAQ